MARKTREQFAQIIEREFRKTLKIRPTARVLVDMSEDEVIRVLCDNDIYECDCDNDEEFIFVSSYNVVNSRRLPGGLTMQILSLGNTV
jgi:hypothetical protein